MDRNAIAETLERHGFLLEMEGANPFQVRAYANVARELRHLTDFEERLAAGSLGELKGFGKVMVEKVTMLAADRIPPAVAELEAKYPPGFLGLTAVPGLGPKKLKALWEAIAIGSPGELEYACRENRLAGIPGFGGKTQEKLLRSLEFLRASSGWVLVPEAEGQAARLAAEIGAMAGVRRVEIAGALRRRREVLDRLDLVVEADDDEAFERALTAASTRKPGELPVRLTRATAERFGAALLRATGSDELVGALAAWASAAGRSLDDIPGEESDVLSALGLPAIPPELREDPSILARAAAGLPRLVEPSDLFGIFHLHTTASDGALTLRETCEAALRLGYRAVGISDHSKTAAYAGGLDAARIREQRAEIDALRADFPGLAIWHGTESDILGDGSLDFDEETLAAFDFVVASVHSRFGMSRDEMTARLVTAVSNRYTTILGHPTGRLLLSRPAYDFDLDAVLDAAAASGTAIEVNASPYRLDLDWRDVPKALARGIRLAIDPDAHSLGDLSNARHGVDVARKGGAQAKDVWNAGDVGGLEGLRKGRK